MEREIAALRKADAAAKLTANCVSTANATSGKSQFSKPPGEPGGFFI